jgi:RNA polymerase sigma-70 factor, ECF subfamily
MNREQKLLELAQRFDEKALAEIYDTYSPGLYRYAVRQLGDADTAEECVSEVFSRFLSALKHGQGPTEFLKSYLYRIGHNWITDYFRKKPFTAYPLETDEIIDRDSPDLIEDVSQKGEIQQIRKALTLLTPEQRQVISLRFMEEMSLEETARVMVRPVGAIKSLQHRALNSLKRLVLKEETEWTEEEKKTGGISISSSKSSV